MAKIGTGLTSRNESRETSRGQNAKYSTRQNSGAYSATFRNKVLFQGSTNCTNRVHGMASN